MVDAFYGGAPLGCAVTPRCARALLCNNTSATWQRLQTLGSNKCTSSSGGCGVAGGTRLLAIVRGYILTEAMKLPFLVVPVAVPELVPLLETKGPDDHYRQSTALQPPFVVHAPKK